MSYFRPFPQIDETVSQDIVIPEACVPVQAGRGGGLGDTDRGGDEVDGTEEIEVGGRRRVGVDGEKDMGGCEVRTGTTHVHSSPSHH